MASWPPSCTRCTSYNLPPVPGVPHITSLLHQVYQAVSLKVETETYRRLQQPADPDTGEGLTMGALYWQVLATP